MIKSCISEPVTNKHVKEFNNVIKNSFKPHWVNFTLFMHSKVKMTFSAQNKTSPKLQGWCTHVLSKGTDEKKWMHTSVLTFFSQFLPCGLEPDFTMNPKQCGIHVTTVQRLSISLSHTRYHTHTHTHSRGSSSYHTVTSTHTQQMLWLTAITLVRKSLFIYFDLLLIFIDSDQVCWSVVNAAVVLMEAQRSYLTVQRDSALITTTMK